MSPNKQTCSYSPHISGKGLQAKAANAQHTSVHGSEISSISTSVSKRSDPTFPKKLPNLSCSQLSSSCLVFCHALLTELPAHSIKLLQFVQNAATRLIFWWHMSMAPSSLSHQVQRSHSNLQSGSKALSVLNTRSTIRTDRHETKSRANISLVSYRLDCANAFAFLT